MSVHELIAGYDFSSAQRDEMFIAYDENPEGFERTVRKAANANNPPAALISMIRKGQHTQQLEYGKGAKPQASTLDEVTAIAVRSYNARVAKYPPTKDIGWTDDDAISYAVWVASTWANERWSQDDIERSLRIRIGKPWDSESDPALGTGCPPELRDQILLKLRGFGDMPGTTPDPKLKIDADELALRLLAAKPVPDTSELAARLLASLEDAA